MNLSLFTNIMEYFQIEHEDVYVKMFFHTLKYDSHDYYKSLPHNYIDSHAQMINSFILQYGVEFYHRFLLSEFEKYQEESQ